MEKEVEDEIQGEDCILVESGSKILLKKAKEDYWVAAEDVNKELNFYMQLQDLSPDTRKKKEKKYEDLKINENAEEEDVKPSPA